MALLRRKPVFDLDAPVRGRESVAGPAELTFARAPGTGLAQGQAKPERTLAYLTSAAKPGQRRPMRF